MAFERREATLAAVHGDLWAKRCLFLLDEIELLHGIVKELAVGDTEADDPGVRRSG